MEFVCINRNERSLMIGLPLNLPLNAYLFRER